MWANTSAPAAAQARPGRPVRRRSRAPACRRRHRPRRRTRCPRSPRSADGSVAHPVSGVEEQVRSRLAVLDLEGAEDAAVEPVAQAGDARGCGRSARASRWRRRRSATPASSRTSSRALIPSTSVELGARTLSWTSRGRELAVAPHGVLAEALVDVGELHGRRCAPSSGRTTSSASDRPAELGEHPGLDRRPGARSVSTSTPSQSNTTRSGRHAATLAFDAWWTRDVSGCAGLWIRSGCADLRVPVDYDTRSRSTQ